MDSSLLDCLKQIFDLFQDGVWISSADSTCLFVNKKYEELSGFSKEWMIGRKATSIVDEGIFDVAVNPEVISTGKPVSKLQTLSNGRYLSLDGFPILNDEGKVVMCITFIRDISTIVESQNKLAQQRDLLNALIRINNSAAISSDEDGSNFVLSPTMGDFLRRARILAETDVSILLLGETGVGKDVMAQRVHSMSRRANKPYIKVDCGGISSSLIESELFGYVGGAFTGANRSGRIGLIEAAEGGTVFFDEIGELPLSLQPKLLRFLQDGEIVRVGTNLPKKVNARVVAATNKNLEKAVAAGEFRSDLYYRLKIAVLDIPPLRKRMEDILPMAEFFLRQFSRRYNKPTTLSEKAKNRLLMYGWPGNVRELKNKMQELVVICQTGIVQPEQLGIERNMPIPDRLPTTVYNFDGRDYRELMREAECKLLRAAIEQHSGNMAAASRMLKIDRSTMFRKIKELEQYGYKVLLNKNN